MKNANYAGESRSAVWVVTATVARTEKVVVEAVVSPVGTMMNILFCPCRVAFLCRNHACHPDPSSRLYLARVLVHREMAQRSAPG